MKGIVVWFLSRSRGAHAPSRASGRAPASRFLSGILALTIALLFRAHAAGTNTLTLAQCFDELLAHNDQVLRLRKDVERAAGTKIDIRSRDLPQLAGQGQVGLRGGGLYGGTGAYALLTAEFSQPVFNTGIAATWRRGGLEVVAAEQKLNATIADQARDLRLYYLRAQRLQQLIALSEELEARLRTNVTGEQQRKDTGKTGPRPVLQAKVQLLAMQGELTGLRREEFEVRTRLAEMLNRTMNDLPRPQDILSHETVHLDWPELAQLALARRADLKLLRQLIQITTEDRRIVDAGYFPAVSLVGSALYLPGNRLLYQTTPIIEGQTPYATDGRAGAGMSWQIIDNGSVTGPSRRLDAIRQEYEITLHQLEQNIPRELARIQHSLEDAESKLTALNKSTAEADEDLRLIENRISLGGATQLDFSNAQRDLLAVRRAVVDALFQYDSALAELDWTSGRYLEFAEPAQPH